MVKELILLVKDKYEKFIWELNNVYENKVEVGENILFKVIKINIEEDLIIIDKKDFVKFGEDEVE